MVFAIKIENFFLVLGRCPVGVPFRDGWRIDQARLTAYGIGRAPSIEARPADPKISAGFCDMADLGSVS